MHTGIGSRRAGSLSIPRSRNLVDYVLYSLNAAEKRFVYLWKMAREHPGGSWPECPGSVVCRFLTFQCGQALWAPLRLLCAVVPVALGGLALFLINPAAIPQAGAWA